jgi:hypothetical protein
VKSFRFHIHIYIYASLAFIVLISSCARQSETHSTEAPLSSLKVTASIQELMQSIVDPSADGVWDAVGTTLTRKGSEVRQPHTDEEWKQVRLRALALIEGTNLLMMDGRRLIPANGRILDEGSEGVLTTVQAEENFNKEHTTFVQFARALNDVGQQMLRAIDERNPDKMSEIGEVMDEVCESCHMKFWYPKQPVWRITQTAASSNPEESVAH